MPRSIVNQLKELTSKKTLNSTKLTFTGENPTTSTITPTHNDLDSERVSTTADKISKVIEVHHPPLLLGNNHGVSEYFYF